MADELLNQAQTLLEGQIDFDGQQLAEQLTTFMITASGILAFIFGITFSDIYLSLYTLLAGSVVSALVVVPPWPFFNQHPVKWLSGPKSSSAIATGITVDGRRVGS